MKVSLRIFRLSRKVVIILIGVLLLGGVAGATAVYIGKDQLLGGEKEHEEAMQCTAVQMLRDHRGKQVWLRKYIKTDEPADGLQRVKTALRVAAAMYDKDKADLIQVVVLAPNGPQDRADMNGHAIGADVVYIPHPETMTDMPGEAVLTARYIDGMATENGDFYGQRVKMPEDEASHIIAALPEKIDCVDPAPPEGAEKAAEGEGGKKEGEAAKSGGEHGAPAAEGEKAATEGEAKPAEGETKPAEGEAKPAEGEAAKAEGEAKPAEAKAEKGWFDSVKSMVFGGGEEKAEPAAKGEAAPAEAPAAAGENTEAPKGSHEATPASGEAARAEGEAKPAASEASAEEGKLAPGAAPEEAKSEKGWFDSVKSMVLGGEEEKKAEPAKGDAAEAGAPPAEAKAASGEEATKATESAKADGEAAAPEGEAKPAEHGG